MKAVFMTSLYADGQLIIIKNENGFYRSVSQVNETTENSSLNSQQQKHKVMTSKDHEICFKITIHN
jgi:hypothetical protein